METAISNEKMASTEHNIPQDPLLLEEVVAQRLSRDKNTGKIPPEASSALSETVLWINSLSPSLQALAIESLSRAIGNEAHNLSIAHDSGLLTSLIAVLPNVTDICCFEKISLLLVSQIGSFSSNPSTLHTLFSLATNKLPLTIGDTSQAVQRREILLKSLSKLLSKSSDVQSFFLFDSPNASIEVESETVFDSKWPSSYSAFIWVMFDDLPTANPDDPVVGIPTYEPRILSFVNTSGTGLEVYLKEGGEMIVKTTSGSSAIITPRFQIGKFHHIVVSHNQGKELLGKPSKLSVFIDGQLKSESILKFPSCSGILAQRSIGNVSQKCSTLGRRGTRFGLKGKIASVSMTYSGQISTKEVEGIFLKGPDFVLTTNYFKKLKNQSIVDFTFVPNISSEGDEYCINAEQSTKIVSVSSAILTLGAVTHVLRKPLKGKMCFGARIIKTASPKRSLSSSVGICSILPLFHSASLKRSPKVLSIACEILCSALTDCIPAIEDYTRNNGSVVLAKLLEDCPSEAIDENALHAFTELGRCLESYPETSSRAYHPLILNFRCWKQANIGMQHQLSSSALALVSTNPQFFREALGIPSIFKALETYSLANSVEHVSGSLSTDDLIVIRSLLCKMIEAMFTTAAETVRKEEIATLVEFFQVNKEKDLADIAQLVTFLLFSPSKAFIDQLSEFGGCKPFLKLLSMSDTKLRLYGIQILGLYIRAISSRDNRKFATSEFPFEQIREYLEPHPFEEILHFALSQLLCEDYESPLSRPRSFSKLSASGKKMFINTEVLNVVFELLCAEIGRATTKTLPLTVKLVEDVTVAIEISQALQICILNQDLWQNWFINLLLQEKMLRVSVSDFRDPRILCANEIHKLVIHTLSVLLKNAMMKESGWKATEDFILLLESGSFINSSDSIAKEVLNSLIHDSLSMIRQLSQPSMTILWINFVNIASLVESLIFVDSRKVARYHTTTVKKDERGIFVDIELVCTTLTMFDALWSFEYIKSYGVIILDTIFGRKRSAHVVILRLSLALFRETLPYFSSPALQPEDFQGELQEIFSENSKRLLSIIRWLYSRTIQRDSGIISTWVIYDLFRAIKRTLKTSPDTCAALFQIAVNVAVSARQTIQGAITPKKQSTSSSPSLTPNSNSNSQQVQQIDNSANVVALSAFLFEESQASDFLDNWFVPCFVNGKKTDQTVIQLRSSVKEFEIINFSQLHTKVSQRREAVLTSIREDSEKRENMKRIKMTAFTKEFMRITELIERRAKESLSRYAFSEANKQKTFKRLWKNIVREAASVRGCWSYSDGRAFWPKSAQPSKESQANQEELEVIPIMKVDNFETSFHTRPFLKIDFDGSCLPRREHQHNEQKQGKSSAVAATASEPGELATKIKAKHGESTSTLEPNNNGIENVGTEDADFCMVEEGITTEINESEEGNLPSVGSRILTSQICNRIYLFDKIPGVLCLTEAMLYFFHENDNDGSKGFKSWPLTNIARIFNRRYTVSSALEFFVCNSGRGYFFEFPNQKVFLQFSRKLSSAVSSKRGGIEYIRDPCRSIRKSGITTMWQHHEISNFQYLSILNSLAGRTLNDLAQYPVFPWILSEYSSKEIDVSDPTIYRDLSKPVGALNQNRLEGYLARFNEMKQDRESEIPPFMYGSHYSAVGAVLFWLTRMEPYSRVSRELQGGDFDYADRLFFTIANAFENCLTSSSDVKELVPEFFYNSEFLRNRNHYWLGKRQNGNVVWDVGLPPWAQNSPELFVRFNQEALESEFVSIHLHEWIDLIFGFKQRGQAAIDANNVFYYLTYPDSIDPTSVEGDDISAAALRTQLAYFGQTPAQLFTTPHPPRDPPTINSALSNNINRQEITNKLSGVCDFEPIQAISAGDCIVTLRNDGVLIAHVASDTKRLLTTPTGGDGPLALPYFVSKPITSHLLFQGHVIATSRWKSSVYVIAIHGPGGIIQTIDLPEFSQISCLNVDENGTTLLVGSTNGKIGLLDIKPNSALGRPPVISEEGIKMIFVGHHVPVSCICVDNTIGVCASGDEEGNICTHHLLTGRLLGFFADEKEEKQFPVISISLAKNGDVVYLRKGSSSMTVLTNNCCFIEKIQLPCFVPPLIWQTVIKPREAEQEEMIVVVDSLGITFITTKLQRLPNSHDFIHWNLPPANAAMKITNAWLTAVSCDLMTPIQSQSILSSSSSTSQSNLQQPSKSYSEIHRKKFSKLLLQCTQPEKQQAPVSFFTTTF